MMRLSSGESSCFSQQPPRDQQSEAHSGMNFHCLMSKIHSLTVVKAYICIFETTAKVVHLAVVSGLTKTLIASLRHFMACHRKPSVYGAITALRRPRPKNEFAYSDSVIHSYLELDTLHSIGSYPIN